MRRHGCANRGLALNTKLLLHTDRGLHKSQTLASQENRCDATTQPSTFNEGPSKCVSAQQERCAAKQNNPHLLIQKAHHAPSRSVKGHQKGKHISCDSRQRCTCDTIALLRTQPDTTRSNQTWEQVVQRTAGFCASVPSVQHLAVRESHFSPSWHKSSTASAQTYRLISDDQGNIKPLPVLQRVD